MNAHMEHTAKMGTAGKTGARHHLSRDVFHTEHHRFRPSCFRRFAQALAARADLQTRLSQLAKRATKNARHQEGEAPAEDAATLLVEMDQLSNQLETMIVQINVRNLSVEVAPGMSMTAALARRDTLRRLQKSRTDLADAASVVPDRYSRTELRTITSLDVRVLRTEADAYAKQARELDVLIQGINWTTDLEG